MILHHQSGRVVPPGSTVGMIGGGQLGRMMILEGRKMGYRFIVWDQVADSPAAQVADKEIVADYSDRKAASSLAKACDVVTYEFENVDPACLRLLEQEGVMPQPTHLLELTRHRVSEKKALKAAGIPVAPFRIVHQKHELATALSELGTPAVLKTATGGYDGKGQSILHTEEDVSAAWSAVGQDGEAFVLEKFIPFACELSVIIARSTSGEVRTFPLAENVHRNHVLHQTIVPARVSDEVAREAERVARLVVESLPVIGLIAVEMFLTATGEIIVNELAPRPHNSGHFTYEACVTSQFEQHLRAVCGLPLGSTRLLSPVVMVNLLGDDLHLLERQLPYLPDSVKVHIYGKHEVKAGRKMGHLCIVDESITRALAQAERIGMWEQKQVEAAPS
ncbi:5-(carboxyamino)imidazole ribonucleotide synthase [Mechercharimyces sp. CAU 1602]|uniref:5-(carboxyamino)imidazole ribonucleotide synthase n=1 Tax=Mechercharimyces sp. CAU 1602 TaxID=2973933 RepID=UPI002162782C|nr:5-(carboxyamino)imidazole ribonucleotide synthase [Mechercharimyces sp. CAU 1602]MCS1352022.1 5-(carboxyamino)imidazole ribonucleotide synthase [Mechercharimyces sp. CAU 1602]